MSKRICPDCEKKLTTFDKLFCTSCGRKLPHNLVGKFNKKAS